MKTTAIFLGSFDPFTIGHDDIARRALLIADRLVIAVGVNDKKKYESDTEQRVEAIARIYAETGWELRKDYSPGWNMGEP